MSEYRYCNRCGREGQRGFVDNMGVSECFNETACDRRRIRQAKERKALRVVRSPEGAVSPRWFARFVCRHRGHRNAAWMLPEREFGLYAYSRLFCSRCDLTFEWRPGFERGR